MKLPKRPQPMVGTIITLIIIFGVFLMGCATPPPPIPQPDPEPTIEPIPEPIPEPIIEEEPPTPITLEGPKWLLTYLHGTDRVRIPEEEIVWIVFSRQTNPEVFGFGGVNQIRGGYNVPGLSLQATSSPLEGLITFGPRTSTRMAGPYLGYEQVFLFNLGLVQGYFIQGSTIEDGKLTLYGGHGREEIILAEFRSEEFIPD